MDFFWNRFFLVLLTLILFSFLTEKSYAASLASVSDTISTSRPSASNVLSADQAANATQVSVIDLGQSASTTIYLASDAATFRQDTGETMDAGVNVASMSAQISGTPNTRNIYFTTGVAHAHHKGDPVTVPITAVHSLGFTIVAGIPSSGKIVITFPALTSGDANNAASPSATTFQTNGLAQANFKVYDVTASSDITTNFTANSGTIAVTAPSSGTSPTITLTQGTTTSISAGHALKIFIGCTSITGSGSSAACGTNVPTLINPTKSFGATTGNADIWKVAIQTQDNNSVTLDTGSAKIGTVESVQVQATVEPTLTFTITGQTAGANINTISGSCGSITTTSPGINTTATSVNLGVLSNGQVNTAAQQLSVSTNGATGYTITATSSGRFINPGNGNYLTDANDLTSAGLTANDTPVPKTVSAGQAPNGAFGIHACGADSSVNTDQWVNAGTITTAKFSNPWNTGTNGFYNTIASHTSGPVTSANTAILYAATVTATTPPGIYVTTLTYVASATF